MRQSYKVFWSVILTIIFSFQCLAQAADEQNSRLVLNVKNTVAAVGTEPNRKIKIRLKDGTKLKGYITEIKDDHFAMLDDRSGKVVSVDYSRVIEAQRDGLSRFAKSLIASSVVMGLIFIPVFIGLSQDR